MKDKPIVLYRRVQNAFNSLHVFSENNQVYKKSNQREWLPINFRWESITE